MRKRRTKISKSTARKLKRMLRTNNSAETELLTSIIDSLEKQGIAQELTEAKSPQDIDKTLKKISFKNLAAWFKRLGRKILKRNREGFQKVTEALTQGVEQTGAELTKEEKKQLKFKKAVNSLAKEEKYFQPMLDKFYHNLSLIKNLPEDLGEKLKEAYFKGEGLRGSDVEELFTERMKSRARLIIRTESSKINSALTEVRAKSTGLNAYTWLTSEDIKVRASHKLVDGVLFFWDDPPTLDKMTGHAGEFPNCRCISVPIFEIDDITFPVKVAEHLVAIGKYDKSTKKDRAIITGGRIQTYSKQEFIAKYGNKFN